MERSLVERARAGDADAFDQLVRGRIDTVYRVALGVLGNATDARDATQETFIAVWRHLPGLRDADRFDGWLHRITVNAARMVLRHRRGVRELHLDPATDPPRSSRPLAPEGQLTASAFDRAFDRLSVEQRAILVAHHLEGRSVTQVARALAIPEGTVKSRLHAARQVLQRELDALDR
jgi:RNA polymerase sigma-70 factor (ECF subfamily)